MSAGQRIQVQSAVSTAGTGLPKALQEHNVYNFGDSVSTTGNNIHIYGSNRTYRPQGRYADGGRCWVDYFASSYCLKVHNAYDPNFTRISSHGGQLINFAVGGWTTDNYLNGDPSFSAMSQIDKFEQLLANSDGFDAEGDVVIFSTAFANDLLQTIGVDSNNYYTVDPVGIQTIMDNTITIITRLYNLGVRHVVLMDPVGIFANMPLFLVGINDAIRSDFISKMNAVSADYREMLAQRNVSDWPLMEVAVYDMGSVVNDILSNFGSYGIRQTTISDPSASLIVPTSIPQCIFPWVASLDEASYLDYYGSTGYGLKDQLPNRLPFNAVFWDDAHFTSHIHSILARKFADILARRNYVSEKAIQKRHDIPAFATPVFPPASAKPYVKTGDRNLDGKKLPRILALQK
jgi:phospholipase/lecithinase/hemolysin